MIPKSQHEIFLEALHYCNMEELPALCKKLNLSSVGAKARLINRIFTFATKGTIVKDSAIPQISKAVKGEHYPLKPSTKILFGSYKNDTATRAFFKSLIGHYFHFTAFGQDWIKERWADGAPPTYKEFAEYWQQEYAARKQKKATPKREWAYINFMQMYGFKYPAASKQEILDAWHLYRLKMVKNVYKYLFNMKLVRNI